VHGETALLRNVEAVGEELGHDHEPPHHCPTLGGIQIPICFEDAVNSEADLAAIEGWFDVDVGGAEADGVCEECVGEGSYVGCDRG
jgi:hypothetical protein